MGQRDERVLVDKPAAASWTRRTRASAKTLLKAVEESILKEWVVVGRGRGKGKVGQRRGGKEAEGAKGREVVGGQRRVGLEGEPFMGGVQRQGGPSPVVFDGTGPRPVPFLPWRRLSRASAGIDRRSKGQKGGGRHASQLRWERDCM